MNPMRLKAYGCEQQVINVMSNLYESDSQADDSGRQRVVDI
jgi:hypothetical protein